jgi:hypothetical protein
VAAEFLGVDSERQIRSLTGYGQAFCDAVIGFLAGVSPDMHDFWNESAERRMNDVINITKTWHWQAEPLRSWELKSLGQQAFRCSRRNQTS